MRFSDVRLSRIRTRIKKEKHKQAAARENAPPGEESVWMKTIILGEKCRVPNSDDDDEDMVVYDERGNKKRMYHPKTPRSLPVSRTNSFITSRTNSFAAPEARAGS